MDPSFSNMISNARVISIDDVKQEVTIEVRNNGVIAERWVLAYDKYQAARGLE